MVAGLINVDVTSIEKQGSVIVTVIGVVDVNVSQIDANS